MFLVPPLPLHISPLIRSSSALFHLPIPLSFSRALVIANPCFNVIQLQSHVCHQCSCLPHDVDLLRAMAAHDVGHLMLKRALLRSSPTSCEHLIGSQACPAPRSSRSASDLQVPRDPSRSLGFFGGHPQGRLPGLPLGLIRSSRLKSHPS